MGRGNSKEFHEIALLPITNQYITHKQPKLPDRLMHIESLEEFEGRKGNGFPTAPVETGGGKQTYFSYIVLESGEVRYASFGQEPNIPKLKGGEVPFGHTSLLPDSLYEHAYDTSLKQKKRGVVKYAGAFYVDSKGKLFKWNNDSGHFMPFKAHHEGVSKALGIDPKTFEPVRNSRAMQEMLNVLNEGEYDANANANNYGIYYQNEYDLNGNNGDQYQQAFVGGYDQYPSRLGNGYHSINSYPGQYLAAPNDSMATALVLPMVLISLFCVIFLLCTMMAGAFGAICGYFFGKNVHRTGGQSKSINRIVDYDEV